MRTDGPGRAARGGMDPSRASRVVTAAIASGHVRRVADQRDARRVGLELTAAGRALSEEVHAWRRSVLARAVADWPAADRERFAELLTRFVGGFTPEETR